LGHAYPEEREDGRFLVLTARRNGNQSIRTIDKNWHQSKNKNS
jgi:hypothetical protein